MDNQGVYKPHTYFSFDRWKKTKLWKPKRAFIKDRYTREFVYGTFTKTEDGWLISTGLAFALLLDLSWLGKEMRL